MSLIVRIGRNLAADVFGERRVLAATRLYDRLARLPFDWSTDGRQSVAALSALRGVAKGRRCFILGNGPSLASMDLSGLANEDTFGLNRVELLKERLGHTPTYVVSINDLVVEQFGAEIMELGLPTFLSWHSRMRHSSSRAPIYIPTTRAREFSTDPRRAAWEGGTVTFVAMQLAYFLGYDTVILIGVDHSFATAGRPHKEVESGGADPNHFDPTYFGKGAKWNLPDLDRSESAYRMAREAFEADGRRILDATVGGRLEVFEKTSYEVAIRGTSIGAGTPSV